MAVLGPVPDRNVLSASARTRPALSKSGKHLLAACLAFGTC
ncbi:MAG: KxYKxGKxW signal peptide domain-containing protein [Acidobacteria bacterium]|nr:KxYKxGKxW signal peptide domain-containing protein [Acidobacteriota bacterium]